MVASGIPSSNFVTSFSCPEHLLNVLFKFNLCPGPRELRLGNAKSVNKKNHLFLIPFVDDILTEKMR